MYPLDLEETLGMDPLKPGCIFARELSYLIQSCNKLIVLIHLNRLEPRRKLSLTYLF